MNKKTLKRIFGISVNAENSNAYQSLGFLLRRDKSKENDKINVDTLAKVLEELSNKWEKEIDEFIMVKK